MPFTSKLTSPLVKCFWDSDIEAFNEVTKSSTLLGERAYFQLCFGSNDDGQGSSRLVYEIKSEIKDYINVSLVENVPVSMPCYYNIDDGNYLRRTPGIYPDKLTPINESTTFYIWPKYYRSLFFELDIPKDAKAGEYPIEITIASPDKAFIYATQTYTVKIIDKVLPKQTLIHTEWFYTDCLADYYRVEPWSEEHWRIVENFVKTAVRNGINMILTPVVTPELDTAVGWERTTVQLVDIKVTKGRFFFNFSKLDRWIDMLDRCGVEYIEICHLFTQWGALHAPKIMATVDGEYKRIFGWETDALGDDYKAFLKKFLPKLLDFLKKKGVDKRCVFHVSDEPNMNNIKHYKACKKLISRYLKGYVIMDALSSLEFYKKGACEHPIPSNDHIQPFLDAKVPDLWTYYCCGQANEVSNRFLSMPGERTRIIGYQLYKYDIKGFLQWGYNFYNSGLSLRKMSPYQTTDGDFMVPAGDTFTVYPVNDGTTNDTLHYTQFFMGLQDMRALQLAESLYGKEKVLEVLEGGLEEKITFKKYPHGEEYLLSTREKINEMIEKA